jgi:hypothetical protein
MGNVSDSSRITSFERKYMVMILAKGVIIGIGNVEFGEDFGTIKLKILAFQGKNDPLIWIF